MVRAVAAAKADDCDKAFKLTLICQCYDGTAQEHLNAAGSAGGVRLPDGQVVGRRRLAK